MDMNEIRLAVPIEISRQHQPGLTEALREAALPQYAASESGKTLLIIEDLCRQHISGSVLFLDRSQAAASSHTRRSAVIIRKDVFTQKDACRLDLDSGQ